MQDFSGSKDDIKKTIADMVAEIWDDFDDDFNGTLDEHECFNFMNTII